MVDKAGPGGNYARHALELFARYGDAEAMVAADGRRLTYAQIRAAVITMAATLWNLGLRPGQALAVMTTNPPESIFLQMGAHLIGCRTAWIAHNAPPHFRQSFLMLAKVDAFVYETAEFSELGDELARANTELPVFCLGAGGAGPDLAALEQIPWLPVDAAEITQEPQSLFQTGGTTGEPKLVHHRHSFFDALRTLSADYLESGEPQLRHLLLGGTWHASSQTAAFMTLFTGGTLFLQPGMEYEDFLHAIESEQINSTMVGPPVLRELLDHPLLARTDCSSLQTLTVSGSAAAPGLLAEAIERFGPIIRVVYGMSEAPFISAMPNLTIDPAALHRLASCGVPYGDIKVEIRDERGNELPVGEVGEVYVSGSLMMAGYWGRPRLTAETLVDGWLRTGDAGRLDEEGYLYLVDRFKDMIVTGMGSTNVYCRPIEDALAAHPKVRAAAVIGVPDDLMGEVVHAFVIPVLGASVTQAELQAVAAAQLNELWSPQSVDFVEFFPLTPSGKVDKKGLRALYHTRTRVGRATG